VADSTARDYVSHYWLSRNNVEVSYAVLPDGAVDIVLALGPASCQIEIFGTTTARRDTALEPGVHYLGIRFRPGQCRHFIDAPVAELTDARWPGNGLVRVNLAQVNPEWADDSVFARLDALLLNHLARYPPRRLNLDKAVRELESAWVPVRIAELAQACGLSLRQFERRFLDAVGISPKLFAGIARFRQAAARLSCPDQSLAQVAADLGYFDQSHMTRAFVRFLGQPPLRARHDVAFLQDACRPPAETADSFNFSTRNHK
jgi:AraC-like DNA-binding protein